MPKRRRVPSPSSSSSKSDDSEEDASSSASSASSLTTQREQLKYMFCNYVDFIFKNGKSKKKIAKALSQSFNVPPPAVSAAKTSSKRRRKAIIKSESENKKRSRKRNLKKFFERKLSKRRKSTRNSSSSDSEDPEDLIIPAKKRKFSGKSKQPVKKDRKQNEGKDKLNKEMPDGWREDGSPDDLVGNDKQSGYCEEMAFGRKKMSSSLSSYRSMTPDKKLSETSEKVEKNVSIGKSSDAKAGRSRILNIGSDSSDSENLIFLASKEEEETSKRSSELKSRSSSESSSFVVTKSDRDSPKVADKMQTLPGKMQTLPYKMQTLPDKMQTLPDKMQTLPDKLQTLPVDPEEVVVSLSSTFGRPSSSESQSNRDVEEPSVDDTSAEITSEYNNNKLIAGCDSVAIEADVSCTSNDVNVSSCYGNDVVFDPVPISSDVFKNRSSRESPYSPKDTSDVKNGNAGEKMKTSIISASDAFKSSKALETSPQEGVIVVVLTKEQVKKKRSSESPKRRGKVPSSPKAGRSRKLVGSLSRRIEARGSSSSSFDYRSTKCQKKSWPLTSPRRSSRSWSDGRSGSSSSGSKSRKDVRREKRKNTKNQMGLYSQRYSSDSYESDSSYERHGKSDFRERDRQRRGDRSSQRDGRRRQPVVKRIKNFLSLDSSVEEVFSNDEVQRKCQKRSESDDGSSWSENDDAKPKNVPLRRRSSSSTRSSPWRLDLEKQRTHRRSQELTPGEDYSFKKRSHNMVKGGLRRHKTGSSSSGSSVEGAKKTKEITISRTIKTTASFEANSGFAPDVADSTSPAELPDEPRAVRKVYMKKDAPVPKEPGSIPGQAGRLEPDEKKENDESRMDLTDSLSNDLVPVDSGLKSLFKASISKENRALMKPIGEVFQGKIDDVGQNSNQQGPSTTPKTPLKISFMPKARVSNLMNVNRLAEASIKSAASKFNMHFAKKSDKKGSHLDHLFSNESGDRANGPSMKKSFNNDGGGHLPNNDLTPSGKGDVGDDLNPRLKNGKAAPDDRSSGKLFADDREVLSGSERFVPSDKVEEKRTIMSSNNAKMSERSTGSKRGNARHLTISSHSSSIARSVGRAYRRSVSRYSSRRHPSSSYSRSRYSRSWSSRRSSSSRRYYRSSRRKILRRYSSRSGSRRGYGYYYRSSSRSRRRSYSGRSSRSFRRRVTTSGSYSRSPLHRDWRSYRRSRSSLRSRSDRSHYSSDRGAFSSRRNVSRDRYDVSSRSRLSSRSSGDRSSGSHSRSGSSPRTTSRSESGDGDARGEEEEDREKIDKQDKEGHLIYKNGDVLMDRYEILSTLGEGTFGKVLECKDRKKGGKLALKVIRNVKKYREAAEVEIEILEKLAEKDQKNESLCIRLLTWFDYNGHTCLSFEVLGLSVYEFLKNNEYRPYPLEHVRHVGHQILTAIKFLHDNKWTHTDLKPENILFVNSDFTTLAFHTQDGKQYKQYNMLKCTDIRLIDFGSATHDDERHTRIVSTRQYRAVEIILELGWHHSCDMWSIGCILFEMYTGNTLFQTHSNTEHLAMMQIILGPLPQKMCSKSRTKYFLNDKLDWDEDTRDGRYVKKNCKPLKNYILVKDLDHGDLFELLLNMLTYDPDRRITSNEAIGDRFFRTHALKS